MSQKLDGITATCIRVLQSRDATDELVLVVRRVMIAAAEMNNRFYVAKTSLQTEQLLACLDEFEAIEARTVHASDLFASDPIGQAANFAQALNEAATQMSQLPRDERGA